MNKTKEPGVENLKADIVVVGGGGGAGMPAEKLRKQGQRTLSS